MDPAQAAWRPADSLASDIVSARQSARHDAIVEEAIARRREMAAFIRSVRAVL